MDKSTKTSVGIAALILGFLPGIAAAGDVVYSPGTCAPQDLVVFVSNKSSQPQRVWTQTRNPDLLDERGFDLAPRTQIKIAGEVFLSSQKAFSVKSLESNTLRIETQCLDEEKILLTGSVSPEVDHILSSSATHVKLSLVNLFLNAQSGKIHFFDRLGRSLGEESFSLSKYYETQTVKLEVPRGSYRLHISSDERIHSQLQVLQGNQLKLSPGVTLAPRVLKAESTKIYFLVSTKENNPEESFVIALDDPAKIATARQQIKDPTLEKIVVGGIQLGNGEFNRSFTGRDKAPYSWSVYRVDAFADFAHIDCDGSPDITEENLMEKLNSGGRVCFWHYRVVRELTLEEVRSGKLRSSRLVHSQP
ncbi:hypothetical protein D3C87_190190 [compost metagenome]